MQIISTTRLSAAIVASVLALGSSIGAHAQRSGTANVPFAFEYMGQAFPAGTYSLRLQENVMSISDGHHSGLSQMRPEEELKPAKKDMLVFYRVGDHLFLREIWTKGDSTHFRFPESKQERNARTSKTYARNEAPNAVDVAF